jgi:glucose/arabinose dehydrogenase
MAGPGVPSPPRPLEEEAVTTPHPRATLRVPVLRSLGAAMILGALAASPSLAVAPDPAAIPARTAAPATVSGLTLIRSGLDQPLFVTHAGDDRLFVVERPGRIRILRDTGSSWAVSTFLDLSGKVDTGHSEQGLLGLAFHPDYATNGRFYVNYTEPAGDTVVAEYRRATARKADPLSKRVLLKVNQPFDNHNGGWLAFKGPYLYIALGDGGSGGDPYGNGQDKNTRLGKILRIDPLDPDGTGPKRYAIPSDNPFVGKPGLDEIWAYGLRNPWRNSFDRETGHLWIGDVGQDRYEEIDRAGSGKGKNFGWDRLEGRHLYPSGALCTTNCRTLPVVEYKHKNGNCSIVGGYVSRRAGAPLEGRYLFGDTCSGRIWDIDAAATSVKPGTPHDTSLFISSFGEGADGRLYVTDLGGALYLVNGS